MTPMRALCALALLAACSAPNAPTQSPAQNPAPAAATNPAQPSPASPAAKPDPSAPAPVANPEPKKPVGRTDTAVVAGTSCAGNGAPSKPHKGASFTRKGDVWSAPFEWGCGCPSAPVFTMVYEPKTSPLKVHLCADYSRDHCEALCMTDLSFDLSAPLREAGAKDIAFVE